MRRIEFRSIQGQLVKGLIFLSLCGLVLTSCVENYGGANALRDSDAVTDEGDSENNGGQSSTPDDGSVADDGGTSFSDGVVELRHVVDPFDGTYKTKVSIPKNFTGLLYLSGLNVTSLKDSIVKVRFKFGRELEPITVPASVGRAPGITPKTNTEVLIMNFEDRPFENLRLFYDLYDYNDYRDGSGNETEDPTMDPRDGGLYCRGLRVEDDPTFQGSATDTKCDEAGEKCLYSYAKVLDSGLYEVSSGTYEKPIKPQLDDEGDGYANLSQSDVLKRCLPDNIDTDNLENVLNTTIVGSPTYDTTTLFGGDYKYRGPYRPTATSLWEITSDAIISEVDGSTPPTGLFQKTMNPGAALDTLADGGYESFKFPRAGKLELNKDVEYFGSADPFSVRSLTSLLSSGETDYLGGCNIRESFSDDFFNEHIGSCNVTAKIDILKRSENSANDELVTSSIDVKIQIVRASTTNFQGEEVLYTSLKTCSSSNACGPSECCFNERCWSDELVSQCLEESDNIGNLGSGEICQSDFECASLCCDPSIGTCQPHTITEDETVLCSKSPGQNCVSKEFCQKENVKQCFIVKTGISPDGQQQCAKRCYNVPTHGDCKNGGCVPPETPEEPDFDEDNPDCSEAIAPPTDLEPL